MHASPKFCIYGAGAIGGMIGTLLARAGATVSVFARSGTLAAVKRDGLQLIIDGETLQARVRASADPAELGPQDYLIIAVKAPNLPDVASRIGPLLGPTTAVVTAMNGVPWRFFANAQGALAGKRLTAVDPDGSIGRAIPAARAIGCVIYTRKSSEEGLEQAFNSLDAPARGLRGVHRQPEARGLGCLAELYDDGGISGGTMDRPALQRLLADIDSGHDRRGGGLQGRPADPLARRLRQDRRGVRPLPRVVRLRDPAVQHHNLDGPVDAQHAAVLRPVRA